MDRAFDWKFWVGLAVSAVFVYLALDQVDLGQVLNEMRSAAPLFLAAGVLMLITQQILRTVRWRLFLDPIQATGFSNRLLAVLVGFAANCLLPARLGEIVRANYIGLREGCSRSSALGTLVVERLFDAVVLLGVLYVGLMITDFTSQWSTLASWLRFAGILLPAAYAGFILVLAGFKWKAEACLRLFQKLLFFLPERAQAAAIDIIRNFSLGLVPMKKTGYWIWAILLSCAVWATGLFQIKFIAVSLNFPLSLASTFIILAIASISVMIPSAPGFIGTFHLAVQYAFMLHGFSPEESLSAAILLHAVFFFPTIVFGVGAFLLIHVPLGRLAARGAASR